MSENVSFTRYTNFPAHNLNFHWMWSWWDQIRATFLNFFYFMIVSENISYTRYTRAFCQVGLPSTLATAFWTKSKNIQQNGASRVITKSPAHICQIPATIHNGERLMQHQKPKNTATRMRKKKKMDENWKARLYQSDSLFELSSKSKLLKLTANWVLPVIIKNI